VVIRAPLETIFWLAADIERWPERLPHYRWVQPLARDETRLLARMSARRSRIPVAWTAVQEVRWDLPAVLYRHVGGFTTGMFVRWRFMPWQEGEAHPARAYRVSITHRLDIPWPGAAALVVEHIIGRHFVQHIAGQTLQRIKQLAEQESTE
jgi:hypothetical protein